MALVSFTGHMIFCPTSGTASTSIGRFLMEHGDFQWVPARSFVLDGVFVDYKHSGLRQLLEYNLIDTGFARDAWSFSLVRNPYSWYVSEYQRHRLWTYLLNDKTSWVHQDPNARARIMAAQGDFLGFCQLIVQQNHPLWVQSVASPWDLFHITATDCSAVFQYEALSSVEVELRHRLGLASGCQLPFVNKTPVSTLLRDNLALFTETAVQLIQDIHRPSFERYGYPVDLQAAAQAVPDIRIPDTLPDDFRAERYLALNPDLAGMGIDPSRHYLDYGQFELRHYK